eukprot:TRINITY_DN11314_c0_g1_i1.p1 TRINITY_DN11314_c0_g1~~TRINITY_DN11314_c0_g1_i1.p1  ORF type:complete len:515 (-),score=44.72 TRINITY_DN11314_c0_g1_i1:220-1764(-)
MSIVIVGGGIVGLTAGAFLRDRGIHDFVILEAEGDVGGTWRDHDYPGAGTDTEAPTYLPTFLPVPDFKSQFATRGEIVEYMKSVMVEQYIGHERIRLNTRVLECTMGQNDKWHVQAETAEGVKTFEARFLILASFSLTAKHVKVPTFPDREKYTGDVVHTSKLKSDLAFYAGKDVVVVGCGATAVQLVPSIADTARSVTVLRRTMPYISIKRKVRPPSSRFGWTLHRWQYEIRNDVISMFDRARSVEWILRGWVWISQYWLPSLMNSSPPLPAAALPQNGQPLQCTRRAFDYLGFRDCLAQPNVHILDVTQDAIKAYSERGLVLESGRVLSAELIIMATGYNAQAPQNYSLIVDGEVATDWLAVPNMLIPLAFWCPLFCIPPRVTEDSMEYFLREYQKHMHRGRVALHPMSGKTQKQTTEIQETAQRNHVLLSPYCTSSRYFIGNYEDSHVRSVATLQDHGVGLPRVLTNVYLRFHSADIWKKDGVQTETNSVPAVTKFVMTIAALALLDKIGS